MNSSELIKILEKSGWRLKRISGSHHQFKHVNFSKVVTVPHPKKDIAKGTLNKI